MKKVKSKTGIVSYGAAIPKYRIRTEDIAKVYGKDADTIKNGLGISEKSVRGLDQDTITLAVNSSKQAYNRLDGSYDIGAIYVGSESHPYAVKSTATFVGEVLGVGNDYTAADNEFACRAGTAGMQMVLGLIDSGRIENGIAVGSDTSQGAPGDALEYSAASGAASFVLGTEKVIAKILHTTSFISDTPDFWRREHSKYPSHGGRFTGKPAYFKHIISATEELLAETKMKIEDFNHVVFHMPNGKFPRKVAKSIGVTKDQLESGLVVDFIGNTYSACSLLGLAAVLDKAKPKEKILMTSYGSGAGSDSFIFEVTEEVMDYRRRISELSYDKDVFEQIQNKEYLNYGQYVRNMNKID